MATGSTNNPQGSQQNLDEFQQLANQIAQTLTEAQIKILSLTDTAKDLSKEFKSSSLLLRSVYENTTDIKNDIYDTVSLASKLGTEYINQEQIQKRINNNITKTQALNTSLIDNLTNGLGMTDSAAQSLVSDAAQLQTLYQGIVDRMDSADEATRKTVLEEEKIVALLISQLQQRGAISASLDEINDKLADSNKQVGETQIKAAALSKIFGTFSGIPFLKDFMNFKKISEDFSKGTRAGFESIGSEIMRVVKHPLFLLAAGLVAIVSIFKTLIKAAFDFDKIATKLGNTLGISRDASEQLLDTFRSVSEGANQVVSSLDKSFLSIKNQAAAMGEVQELLETNAMVTNEMVQSQILMTKQMKMSGEESKGIQELFLLSGKSVESILLNTRRQVDVANKQNGIALSYRKIISDVAKVSSSIAIAYKNNPDLIAKAVIQANKLGMSLEQTEKISKSLLDFESSISGELESELLLGRRLNFEKARALALDGKSAEAATEIVNQIGGLNALTQMNVIQRDRVAASINQSAEELVSAAKRQQILNALGQQNIEGLKERYDMLRRNGDLAGLAKLQEQAARVEGGKALLQDIARADLQVRFEESMERIKQVFTEIASGPLTSMLESIAKFLQNTTALKLTLIGIAAVVGAIAASLITAAVAATIASGGSNLVAAAAIGGGALLAGGVTAAILSGGSETPTAAAPPPPTTPGFQNRNTGTTADNAASSQRLEEKLDKLATAIEKDRNIYLDTTKVNTALGMGSRQ